MTEPLTGPGSLVIRTDGALEVIHFDGAADSLRLKYAALGCRTVDLVQISDVYDMWLDDEGMYVSPVNMPASMLAERFGCTWQKYHGDVVITGSNDEGDTIDLTVEQFDAVRAALQDIAAELLRRAGE